MNLPGYLQNYNNWRRGCEGEQPSPRELGIAIELAIFRLRNIEKMRSALEFYADCNVDDGVRARDALMGGGE